MSKERFVERQAEVANAAARLREAVAAPESSLVRDAVIQRFEFAFELVWKTLKLYLERQGHECGSPRPTLKKAFSEGLIPTAEEADEWLQMLEDRNLTSHAYDEALATRIYQNVVRIYSPLLSSAAAKLQALKWARQWGAAMGSGRNLQRGRQVWRSCCRFRPDPVGLVDRVRTHHPAIFGARHALVAKYTRALECDLKDLRLGIVIKRPYHRRLDLLDRHRFFYRTCEVSHGRSGALTQVAG